MIQFLVVRSGRSLYKRPFQRVNNPPIRQYTVAVMPVHLRKRELHTVNVRVGWVWILALVWCVAGSAGVHAATAVIGEVDVRAEIAAALFAASATQAAAE